MAQRELASSVFGFPLVQFFSERNRKLNVLRHKILDGENDPSRLKAENPGKELRVIKLFFRHFSHIGFIIILTKVYDYFKVY